MYFQTYKFYLVTLANFVTSLNPLQIIVNSEKSTLHAGVFYRYSQAEIDMQKKESKWCHQYYNRSLLNPYFNFMFDVSKKLEKPASARSKITFDNLYDSSKKPRIWKNFLELNNTLTSEKLSDQVTLNINWNHLYHEVNVSNQNINILDQLQLRFYNIIAKVFGKTNVLHLVQNVKIDHNLNYFSKTIYYQNISAIIMQFSPKFCDSICINHEYQVNHFATFAANIAAMHEYAQALVVYASNNKQQRSEFNTQTANFFNQNSSNKLNYKNKLNLSDVSIFNDVTESLIWTLVNNCGIDSGNDPIKKMLIPFLVINSTESRMAWVINSVYDRDRLFTEAFSKWLGTPATDRDYSWQLLNAYFMRLFPNFYGF